MPVLSCLCIWDGERHRMEQANRQVDIVLDWAQVKQLADRKTFPRKSCLKNCTEIFPGPFKEATLNDLIANRTVLVKAERKCCGICRRPGAAAGSEC